MFVFFTTNITQNRRQHQPLPRNTALCREDKTVLSADCRVQLIKDKEEEDKAKMLMLSTFKNFSLARSPLANLSLIHSFIFV